MLIEIRTASTVDGDEKFVAHAKDVVQAALERFSKRISRVDVHVGDENGDKGGADDTRCVMEARLEGRPPAAVTHHGANAEQAIAGAAAKLKRMVESTLGRESSLSGHRDR